MTDRLGYLRETASQTAGPYVHIGLIPHQAGFDIFEKNFSNVLVAPQTRGERITIEGRVLDGVGEPLKDALVEIWQANADGRFNHPADRQQGKTLGPSFRGGPGRHRFRNRRLPFRDDQAGRRRRAARPSSNGPAHQFLDCREGDQHRAAHQDVFFRRACSERAGSGAEHHRGDAWILIAFIVVLGLIFVVAAWVWQVLMSWLREKVPVRG